MQDKIHPELLISADVIAAEDGHDVSLAGAEFHKAYAVNMDFFNGFRLAPHVGDSHICILCGSPRPAVYEENAIAAVLNSHQVYISRDPSGIRKGGDRLAR